MDKSRTTETVVEELSAIAGIAEQRSLSTEEIANYEALESELAQRRSTEKILARHGAYVSDTDSVASLAAVAYASTAKVDDTQERAFESYLRTGRENADLVELRAQGVGTDSAGGYLVPPGFLSRLVDVMKEFGGVANVVETVTTSTGNNLEFPTVNDTSNVGEIVAESGTFASGADMTFGTVTLGAYKYMAGGASNAPLRVSVELLQDSAFDVQGLVTRKLGERIARLQAQHIVRGTGTGQPKGIVTGLTGVEIEADTAGVTYADLVKFIHSVDAAYRPNARWAFNDNTLKTLRLLEDSNGDPLWRNASADMATGLGGGTLLGYPVTIDSAFLDIDADSNTVNWGVFGDLREGYLIRRVREIQLVVNPWTRAANGQVEFTAWARMDATQQNTSAYVALTGEA